MGSELMAITSEVDLNMKEKQFSYCEKSCQLFSFLMNLTIELQYFEAILLIIDIANYKFSNPLETNDIAASKCNVWCAISLVF